MLVYAILNPTDVVVNKRVVVVASTQTGCADGCRARAYTKKRLSNAAADQVTVDNLVVRSCIRTGSCLYPNYRTGSSGIGIGNEKVTSR